jgi:hypothetical protein
MKILFLDIDGVLNNSSENYRTPGIENMNQLKRIIKETDAEIVLTSTWRYSLEEALKLFRMYDVKTPISLTQVLKPLERGNEIVLWLASYPMLVDTYCVIDDAIEDISGYPLKNIVEINPAYGLTAGDADKTINILNK